MTQSTIYTVAFVAFALIIIAILYFGIKQIKYLTGQEDKRKISSDVNSRSKKLQHT